MARFSVAHWAGRLAPQSLLTDALIIIHHRHIITGTPHPTGTRHRGEATLITTTAHPVKGKKVAVDRIGKSGTDHVFVIKMAEKRVLSPTRIESAALKAY